MKKVVGQVSSKAAEGEAGVAGDSVDHQDLGRWFLKRELAPVIESLVCLNAFKVPVWAVEKRHPERSPILHDLKSVYEREITRDNSQDHPRPYHLVSTLQTCCGRASSRDEQSRR